MKVSPDPTRQPIATRRRVSWSSSGRAGIGLLLVLLVAGCGGDSSESQSDQDETGSEQTETNGRILKALKPGLYKQSWIMPDESLIDFVISVPQTLEAHDSIPLVLALHFGADQYKRFFGGEMLAHLILPGFKNHPAIIVAPDISGQSWANPRNEQAVMALLEEICKTYSIDRQRIMVTGYSLGARGVWHFAGKFPDYFTGAIAVSGRPPRNFADINWSVPMLCVHSASDEVFPMRYTREAVESIQSTGDQAIQLYEVDDVSHYESRKYIEPLQHATDWMFNDVWGGGANQSASPDSATPTSAGDQ